MWEQLTQGESKITMQNNEHYFNIDTNEYLAIKREIEITSRYTHYVLKPKVYQIPRFIHHKIKS